MQQFYNAKALRPLSEVLAENGFLVHAPGYTQGALQYWDERGMICVVAEDSRVMSKEEDEVSAVWFVELVKSYGLKYVHQ